MQYLKKTDVLELHKLEKKNIKVDNLSNIFSKINLNERFSDNEKEVLKKILVDNINNAFKRKTKA